MAKPESYSRLGFRIPHWSTWLLVVMGLWVAAALSWHRIQWGPPAYALVISAVWYPPLLAGSAVLALRVSRRADIHPRERRGWTIFALAFLSMGTACALLLSYALRGFYEFPSMADGLFMLFYPVMMGGLLSLPFSPAARFSRAVFWIDVSIVAVAGFMISWLYVLGPTISASQDSLLARVLSLTYPINDLALLFGLVASWLRRGPGQGTGLTMLCLGTLNLIGADTVWGYQLHQGTYQPGSVADSLWCTAYFLFALGAYMEAGSKRHREQQAPEAQLRSPGQGSYLAVTLSYIILVLLVYRNTERDDLIFAALFAASCLLIARLFVMNQAKIAAEKATSGVEARFRALVQNAADAI
ncbi:MAG TPA: hypothetical protein VD902_01845, partial [Symbiobacteriaceae bacterium]|nr:hypothetical protein [Symbiobacteriaceae bacterium]